MVAKSCTTNLGWLKPSTVDHLRHLIQREARWSLVGKKAESSTEGRYYGICHILSYISIRRSCFYIYIYIIYHIYMCVYTCVSIYIYYILWCVSTQYMYLYRYALRICFWLDLLGSRAIPHWRFGQGRGHLPIPRSWKMARLWPWHWERPQIWKNGQIQPLNIIPLLGFSVLKCFEA